MRLSTLTDPRKRREQGNVAVELALAMPLLLLIIAGVVDLGLLFWEKHVLTNATREGARAAVKAVDTGTAVNAESTQSQIQQVVQTYLNNFAVKDLDGSALVLNGSTFSYTWSPTAAGTVLTVALNQIPYRMMLLPNTRALFGYTRTAGDDAFYLNAQTSMAAEWTTPPGP
jgi:Flp pilus assembly protein TadG